jgi:hypothetical protein
VDEHPMNTPGGHDMTKHRSSSPRHSARAALAAVIIAVLSLGTITSAADASGDRSNSVQSTGAERIAARDAVQNRDGSPKKGLDPAAQRQTSLAAAAAMPNGLASGRDPVAVPTSSGVNADAAGVNEGTKKPASDVEMANARQVKPEHVLSETSKNGGCTPGYGIDGQCLPAVPPSHAAHADHVMAMAWTCAEARTLLPGGIAVIKDKQDTKVDPLNLDTNEDGIACGTGDTA